MIWLNPDQFVHKDLNWFNILWYDRSLPQNCDFKICCRMWINFYQTNWDTTLNGIRIVWFGWIRF
jgi:hypothetical protein